MKLGMLACRDETRFKVESRAQSAYDMIQMCSEDIFSALAYGLKTDALLLPSTTKVRV